MTRATPPAAARRLPGDLSGAATVYAHVRLRLQRDAINVLGTTLDGPTNTQTGNVDGDEQPPCAALVR
ncbi:hypothetical protein [Streptomyces parvulus]|uniref:hypothetical protein n=1 Tax=Streptomyces parvulus TaxID=146923 RepID=UPI003712E00A